MRMAVTSRDGVSVNERLARSSEALLFQVTSQEVRFEERRPVSAPGTARPDADAWGSALQDCEVLVTVAVTGAMRRGLEAHGLRVEERRGPIVEVLADVFEDGESDS